MIRFRGLTVCLLFALCSAAAPAEVTVSITITGPVAELVPVLQKLQELGLGGASPAEDPLKLNVHSVITPAEAAAAPAAPSAPPAPTQPAIESVTVEPAAAKVGDSVLITAKVADPARAVDTVAASVGSVKVDLFDNGTQGDVTAGDGIWSRKTALPATLAAGETAIAINAYDANGETVKVPGADGQPAPVTAQANLTVTP
ncbi:MAG: hypothetical protein FJY92_05060 [Candidatus Hydrogenedentes bacterium]|nr:hypothetical protein [Candidatus Hydrogenedentota bacterium]